jgi:DNA-binding beta-propeller fold protein YncE
MKKNLLLIIVAALSGLTALAQTTSLGTTNLLEGPAAGSDSVVLMVTPPGMAWTATTNADWLHLSAANQNGMGNTNVIFTFDANPGATRTGTLTLGGATLNITQAGSSYVTANPITTLVSSGLDYPAGVAVDGSGNVYIADTYNNALKEWNVASNTVTTLVSSGLDEPFGLAVDGSGNVYIANTFSNAIAEWNAANNTVTTLVSSGLLRPYGVAIDGSGNIYIADSGHSAIEEWNAASNTVTTLVSSGLDYPNGVAVDGSDNVYIADSYNNAIKEWNAASNAVTPLVASGLDNPFGVAVGGSGNVYIADSDNSAVKEWNAASNTVTTLAAYSSGLVQPFDVAVDGSGNVYIADSDHSAIKELPRAFVNPDTKIEPTSAGADALPVVLPATENLTGPFAPVSSQSWLTITGVTNGVVSYAFASTTTNRTGYLTVLSQRIAVTQAEGVLAVLATTNLLEGPAAGSDSVVLTAITPGIEWAAASDASWLHLNAANQSGTGSTNVIFTFDANLGVTRAGTLTLGGVTLNITQAGSSYVAANPVTTLASSGLNNPAGVAVDESGNVYIADSQNSAIKEWNATNNTVTTLVSTGLDEPFGLAVDESGNVYIADSDHSAVKEWNASNNTVTTLASSSSGLYVPFDVAVNGSGNVYIANSYDNAISEWIAASNTVTTLVSTGLDTPSGVAVDGSGNVYIADFSHSAIKEWKAASNTVTTLVASGLNSPNGVAVDGSGNVYIADTYNEAIKEWKAASNTVTTLVASGLPETWGVAVDGSGNVYIADYNNSYYNNGAIKELPHAYVDPVAKIEPAAAGSDVLPVVLPATENLTGPFAPASSQSWLTITGVTNGVVSFSFPANNSGSNLVANITLLGVSVPVSQSFIATPITTPPVLLTTATPFVNGCFQFTFTNNPTATFTVLASTNVGLPLVDWTVIGAATNLSGDIFQFTSPQAATNCQMFYRVTSP